MQYVAKLRKADRKREGDLEARQTKQNVHVDSLL